jgi:hypothetical protein
MAPPRLGIAAHQPVILAIEKDDLEVELVFRRQAIERRE